MGTKSKILPTALIATVLIGTWIDTMPAFHPSLRMVKEKLDYVLDKTGLWQGPWQLFAPNVDSVNSVVSATVLLTDGRLLRWDSPRWRTLSRFERFMRFRESEYFDSIRSSANKPAWRSFGRYLEKVAYRQTKTPVARLLVQQHFVFIADPIQQTFIPYSLVLPYVKTETLFDSSGTYE